MSSKHLGKYLQKYHKFLSFATIITALYACSTTKKVPDGEYLLVKNTFKYEDGKILDGDLESSVSQKPNKKTLFVVPLGLLVYNMSNAKYDTILSEYFTYPREMRNRKLLDSLFKKNDHPEYAGKSLFWDRTFHNFGQPPVILDQGKTEGSATAIRKRMIYRGYWDAQVKFKNDLDSTAKKAKVTYLLTHRDPTFISDYYYDIGDTSIKAIYNEKLHSSLLRSGDILDQKILENEVKRINELMRSRGYYQFNNSNQEIYFTADTLSSRKQVPLTMTIRKDSANSLYKKATIGNIDVAIVEKMSDFLKNTQKDSLRGIRFHMLDDQYKKNALWRAIILNSDSSYQQKNLDLTKRNILATNNFSILKAKDSLRRGGSSAPNDSIVDVLYILKPLDKYQLKVGTDINYSQLLNLGINPSVDLTRRNLFGGMENLSFNVSGTFGSIKPKNLDRRLFAFELSPQVNLSFPRLLMPFKTWKLIPKRYSPTSSIQLGASMQQNIGLDRITFNTGLNYFANVNDIVSHRLSLFNMQLSLTQNKNGYYDYFPRDAEIRNIVFNDYSPALYQQFLNQQISSDDLSLMIINDDAYTNSLGGEQLDDYNNFLQSLINKDRQTQDVFISSMAYNFVYNEIGKKDFENPFYFSGKVELAGNMLSLFIKGNAEKGVTTGEQKTLFNIPYSQFVKFDFDVRKYISFGAQTLALRQLIGLGIPYGNSNTMPYIRSYFNGGSNDIRAWRPFGGLGPADSQLDERVRAFVMDNLKLTTNIEYRIPLTDMYEIAAFTDMGNIWSLKDNGFGDQFKFNKFYKQMGIGSGLGLRINVAYITLRLDLAYKVYDPNRTQGEKWVISKWQPLKPTLNIAFGYPF